MAIQLKSPKTPWHFILIFFLFAIGIGTAGYFYFDTQKRHIKKEKQNELLAIADLKASQIANWRKERMSDAEVILENPSAFHHFQDCLNTHKRCPSDKGFFPGRNLCANALISVVCRFRAG